MGILLTVLATVLGCGGGSFEGGVYRGDGFAFRLAAPVPPSWQRIEHSHAALAFRDEAHQATIMINGRCGEDSEDVPLLALTNHLFLQFTEQQIRTQQVVPFDGREALHTELSAKLDGVVFDFDVWVLKKDGCVYDLLHMAPPGRDPASLRPFHELISGFATVDPHANE